MPHDDDAPFSELSPELQVEFLNYQLEADDWNAGQRFQIEEVISAITSDPIDVARLRAALRHLLGGE